MWSLSCICHLPSQLPTYSPLGRVPAGAGPWWGQCAHRSDLGYEALLPPVWIPAAPPTAHHLLGLVFQSNRDSDHSTSVPCALPVAPSSAHTDSPSSTPPPDLRLDSSSSEWCSPPYPGPPLTSLCNEISSLSASPAEVHGSRALEAQDMAAPCINAVLKRSLMNEQAFRKLLTKDLYSLLKNSCFCKCNEWGLLTQ